METLRNMFSNTAPWLVRLNGGSNPSHGIGETQQNNEKRWEVLLSKIFVVNIDDRSLTGRFLFWSNDETD